VKKLLNNPIFVGALVLIAFVFALKNIVGIQFGSAPVPLAEEALIIDPEDVSGETGDQATPPSNIDMQRAGWVELPRRDPFGPWISAQPDIMEPVRAVDKAPASEKYRLVAVMVEKGTKYATLNRTILTEGDYVDEYHVVSIAPDHVMLRGLKGLEKLTFQPSRVRGQEEGMDGAGSEVYGEGKPRAAPAGEKPSGSSKIDSGKLGETLDKLPEGALDEIIKSLSQQK